MTDPAAHDGNPTTPYVTTTDETFERDVIERSHEIPVVVDFWATWCQPCLMLAPVLEKLAAEHAGKFVLVKADTEFNQEAAGQFNVQGIPAVYALSGGEVVDFFSGLLPEEQLREWLERVMLTGRATEARHLEGEQPAEAAAIYRTLIEENPNDWEAHIGLGRALLAQDQREQCLEILTHLEARGFLEPEAEKLKSALHFDDSQEVDIEGLRAAASNEDDLAAQLALAEGLGNVGQHEEAMELCLLLLQKDRKGLGEDARKLMIDILNLLPEDAEAVATFRRRLSMALY